MPFMVIPDEYGLLLMNLVWFGSTDELSPIPAGRLLLSVNHTPKHKNRRVHYSVYLATTTIQVKDCESRGEEKEILVGGQQCTTSAED